MKRLRRGSVVASIPIAVTLLFVAAQVASAGPCYGGVNNGGWAALTDEPYSKGVSSVVDLTPATPGSGAAAIVHPAQVAIASGDFVGWGTAIGVGVDDCPDYFGTRWQLYVDGIAFLQYFCRQQYGSEPATASDQRVEIRHTSCSGSTRWAFFWNGSLKTCQAVNGTRGTVGVGAESINHDPQTINVRYRSLKYRVLGGSWTNWYTSGETTCVSATWYAIDKNSATDYRFYRF